MPVSGTRWAGAREVSPISERKSASQGSEVEEEEEGELLARAKGTWAYMTNVLFSKYVLRITQVDEEQGEGEPPGEGRGAVEGAGRFGRRHESPGS